MAALMAEARLDAEAENHRHAPRAPPTNREGTTSRTKTRTTSTTLRPNLRVRTTRIPLLDERAARRQRRREPNSLLASPWTSRRPRGVRFDRAGIGDGDPRDEHRDRDRDRDPSSTPSAAAEARREILERLGGIRLRIRSTPPRTRRRSFARASRRFARRWISTEETRAPEVRRTPVSIAGVFARASIEKVGRTPVSIAGVFARVFAGA